MSAAEVIEEIKQLPREEQEQVWNFLQQENRQRESAGAEVRYADDAAFDKVAEKVVREHEELFRRLAQ